MSELLAANGWRGAHPPVDLRAVSLVRAICCKWITLGKIEDYL